MKDFIYLGEVGSRPNVDEGERFINRLIFLAIGVAIILGVIIIAPGILRNPIGGLLHYGTCPNCGDSWWLNESGNIPYQPTRALKKGEDYTSEHILYAEITRRVMICKKCLENPPGLDEVRIEQNLLNHEWSSEKAAQVKEAVVRYKEEKLRN